MEPDPVETGGGKLTAKALADSAMEHNTMSAIPEDFVRKTSKLSAEVTQPFPGARKVYVGGSRDDIRVPMRVIRSSS